VVREVLGATPAGRGTAIAEALRAAGRILHRRGIVVVVVDESCPVPRREMLALGGRHEVVVVRASDPLLRSGFPGAAVPVVDPERMRRGVVQEAPRRRRMQAPPGIDVVDLSTDTDYMPAVRAMLERRERRRAR
jgi:hypothetical protein